MHRALYLFDQNKSQDQYKEVQDNKLPLYTCTLTFSPPPRFSEAFISVLKERGDRHYGRDKQQHTHHEPLLPMDCCSVQSVPCGGGGCCWMSNYIRYENYAHVAVCGRLGSLIEWSVLQLVLFCLHTKTILGLTVPTVSVCFFLP